MPRMQTARCAAISRLQSRAQLRAGISAGTDDSASRRFQPTDKRPLLPLAAAKRGYACPDFDMLEAMRRPLRCGP